MLDSPEEKRRRRIKREGGGEENHKNLTVTGKSATHLVTNTTLDEDEAEIILTATPE